MKYTYVQRINRSTCHSTDRTNLPNNIISIDSCNGFCLVFLSIWLRGVMLTFSDYSITSMCAIMRHVVS